MQALWFDPETVDDSYELSAAGRLRKLRPTAVEATSRVFSGARFWPRDEPLRFRWRVQGGLGGVSVGVECKNGDAEFGDNTASWQMVPERTSISFGRQCEWVELSVTASRCELQVSGGGDDRAVLSKSFEPPLRPYVKIMSPGPALSPWETEQETQPAAAVPAGPSVLQALAQGDLDAEPYPAMPPLPVDPQTPATDCDGPRRYLPAPVDLWVRGESEPAPEDAEPDAPTAVHEPQQQAMTAGAARVMELLPMAGALRPLVVALEAFLDQGWEPAAVGSEALAVLVRVLRTEPGLAPLVERLAGTGELLRRRVVGALLDEMEAVAADDDPSNDDATQLCRAFVRLALPKAGGAPPPAARLLYSADGCSLLASERLVPFLACASALPRRPPRSRAPLRKALLAHALALWEAAAAARPGAAAPAAAAADVEPSPVWRVVEPLAAAAEYDDSEPLPNDGAWHLVSESLDVGCGGPCVAFTERQGPLELCLRSLHGDAELATVTVPAGERPVTVFFSRATDFGDEEVLRSSPPYHLAQLPLQEVLAATRKPTAKSGALDAEPSCGGREQAGASPNQHTHDELAELWPLPLDEEHEPDDDAGLIDGDCECEDCTLARENAEERIAVRMARRDMLIGRYVCAAYVTDGAGVRAQFVFAGMPQLYARGGATIGMAPVDDEDQIREPWAMAWEQQRLERAPLDNVVPWRCAHCNPTGACFVQVEARAFYVVTLLDHKHLVVYPLTSLELLTVTGRAHVLPRAGTTWVPAPGAAPLDADPEVGAAVEFLLPPRPNAPAATWAAGTVTALGGPNLFWVDGAHLVPRAMLRPAMAAVAPTATTEPVAEPAPALHDPDGELAGTLHAVVLRELRLAVEDAVDPAVAADPALDELLRRLLAALPRDARETEEQTLLSRAQARAHLEALDGGAEDESKAEILELDDVLATATELHRGVLEDVRRYARVGLSARFRATLLNRLRAWRWTPAVARAGAAPVVGEALARVYADLLAGAIDVMAPAARTARAVVALLFDAAVSPRAVRAKAEGDEDGAEDPDELRRNVVRVVEQAWQRALSAHLDGILGAGIVDMAALMATARRLCRTQLRRVPGALYAAERAFRGTLGRLAPEAAMRLTDSLVVALHAGLDRAGTPVLPLDELCRLACVLAPPDLAYFYERQLASRLLRGRSRGLAQERAALAQLPRMPRAASMLGEVEAAGDQMERFRADVLEAADLAAFGGEGAGLSPAAMQLLFGGACQLRVLALGRSVWPVSRVLPAGGLRLPAPLREISTRFERFYAADEAARGRRSRTLIWCPLAGSAEVLMDGRWRLAVSARQMALLLALNTTDATTTTTAAALAAALESDDVTADLDALADAGVVSFDAASGAVAVRDALDRPDGEVVVHRVLRRETLQPRELAQLFKWRQAQIDAAVVRTLKRQPAGAPMQVDLVASTVAAALPFTAAPADVLAAVDKLVEQGLLRRRRRERGVEYRPSPPGAEPGSLGSCDTAFVRGARLRALAREALGAAALKLADGGPAALVRGAVEMVGRRRLVAGACLCGHAALELAGLARAAVHDELAALARQGAGGGDAVAVAVAVPEPREEPLEDLVRRLLRAWARRDLRHLLAEVAGASVSRAAVGRMLRGIEAGRAPQMCECAVRSVALLRRVAWLAAPVASGSRSGTTKFGTGVSSFQFQGSAASAEDEKADDEDEKDDGDEKDDEEDDELELTEDVILDLLVHGAQPAVFRGPARPDSLLALAAAIRDSWVGEMRRLLLRLAAVAGCAVAPPPMQLEAAAVRVEQPAAAPAEPVLEPPAGEWACEACTLFNPNRRRDCSACGSRRASDSGKKKGKNKNNKPKPESAAVVHVGPWSVSLPARAATMPHPTCEPKMPLAADAGYAATGGLENQVVTTSMLRLGAALAAGASFAPRRGAGGLPTATDDDDDDDEQLPWETLAAIVGDEWLGAAGDAAAAALDGDRSGELQFRAAEDCEPALQADDDDDEPRPRPRVLLRVNTAEAGAELGEDEAQLLPRGSDLVDKRVAEGESEMDDAVRRAAEALRVSWGTAACLLAARRWDVAGAVSAYLAHPRRAREEAGLPGDAAAALVQRPELDECPICCEPVEGGRALALHCGHAFCGECWGRQLGTGSPQCPEAGCAAAAPAELAGLLPAAAGAQWRALLLRSFADGGAAGEPRLVWCKNPRGGCDAMVSTRARAGNVSCARCGYAFCAACDFPAHEPASCEMMTRWEAAGGFVETTGSEAEARRLKQRTTKPCPKCGVRIEKAGGCSHMSCTKCRYEWCWTCGQAYHTTGRCNRPRADLQGNPGLQMDQADREVAFHLLNRRFALGILASAAGGGGGRGQDVQQLMAFEELCAALAEAHSLLAHAAVWRHFAADGDVGARVTLIEESLTALVNQLQRQVEEAWGRGQRFSGSAGAAAALRTMVGTLRAAADASSGSEQEAEVDVPTVACPACLGEVPEAEAAAHERACVKDPAEWTAARHGFASFRPVIDMSGISGGFEYGGEVVSGSGSALGVSAGFSFGGPPPAKSESFAQAAAKSSFSFGQPGVGFSTATFSLEPAAGAGAGAGAGAAAAAKPGFSFPGAGASASKAKPKASFSFPGAGASPSKAKPKASFSFGGASSSTPGSGAFGGSGLSAAAKTAFGSQSSATSGPGSFSAAAKPASRSAKPAFGAPSAKPAFGASSAKPAFGSQAAQSSSFSFGEAARPFSFGGTPTATAAAAAAAAAAQVDEERAMGSVLGTREKKVRKRSDRRDR